MTLQQQAANDLALALVKLHMGAATAMSSSGYAVYIQEHPEAQVYFKHDQFGGLLVEYVFDGHPPVRYDYSPLDPLAAPELAQLLIDQIGRGRRPQPRNLTPEGAKPLILTLTRWPGVSFLEMRPRQICLIPTAAVGLGCCTGWLLLSLAGCLGCSPRGQGR